MLLATFSFQAIGMMAAALVGLLILTVYPSEKAWRWMIAASIAPSLIILFLRTRVPESPRWCLAHGRLNQAIRIVEKLLPHKNLDTEKLLIKEHSKLRKEEAKALGISALFTKKYRKNTALSVIPWFFMDIATYGVGIFTPTIIAAIALTSASTFIKNEIISLEGAAFIDLFLLLGFLVNLFLVDRIGRIKLQVLGFAGMVLGLVTLAFGTIAQEAGQNHLVLSGMSWVGTGQTGVVIIFIGFIIYNFMMNLGPNATTFILAAELFPTKLRATAHGFSAASAKVGAMLGIFFLPIVKASLGLFGTMLILAIISLAGLLVTAFLQVETKGRSLDELESWKAGSAMEQ